MKHPRPLALLAFTALACSSVPLLHLQLNRTESGPVGLWRAHPDRRPVVGDVARFCMRPEHAHQTAGRPYAGGTVRGPCAYRTWLLAKPVVAAAGDTVEHTPAAVVINGRALPLSPTRARDSHGRAIPIAPFGKRVLRSGEYWVHSPYAEASFDSRYVGIVRANQMRGTLTPVLTWITSGQRAALRARGLTPRRCGSVACVQLNSGAQ